MGFRTKQIHAGVEPDPTTGAILTPIHQSTTFVQPSVDEYLTSGYSYSRSSNPTVRAWENKIAALEEGEGAAAFASGMAAISAVFMALCEAGSHVVVSDVAYGGTHRLASQVLSRFGVSTSFVDTSDPEAVEAAVRPETRLILTETPANPTLKLTDIAAISQVARARGIPHAVDNTFLTPYFQRPLALGADVAIHSTTKYLDGHNATVGGSIVTGRADLYEQISFIQNAMGTIMSPQVAWLTLQGVKTLADRMERQSESAASVARFLQGHPKVAVVCYPGLESFPQHDLAQRQATGFGAIVWFEPHGGLEAAKRLMGAVRLWTLAENLGSVESLITHPATMTHAGVPPEERMHVGLTDALVRLSVGLEDVEDLIDDLAVALDELSR